MIVTFYSFKGGVGRSMAMVNVGEILADMGYHVILSDWDLEAPGLERYLLPEDADEPQIEEMLSRPGLMDLLRQYKETLAQPSAGAEDAESSDFAFVGSVPVRKPSSYLYPVSKRLSRPGSLRLLSAGRRDGANMQRYVDAVGRFDWQEFYERWAGDIYIDFLRRDLAGEGLEKPGAADILLIDSRTGVTEHGGVCTHHLADVVVLPTAANDLNFDGTKWMVQALRDPQLVQMRGGRPIHVIPVASRIEQQAQRDELVDFRKRFLEEFRDALNASVGNAEQFALDSEIRYMPYYSFHERIVAREPKGDREEHLFLAYKALADGLVQCGVQKGTLREPTSQGIIARPAEVQTPAGVQAEWNEDAFMRALRAAAGARDKDRATDLCMDLEEHLRSSESPFPERQAIAIALVLRGALYLDLVQRTAEALLDTGIKSLDLRLIHAATLIDLGNLASARLSVEALVAETQNVHRDSARSKRLLARIHEEAYLSGTDPSSTRSRRSLEAAINLYYEAYQASLGRTRWEAVRTAALVVRAQRDGVELQSAPDPRHLVAEFIQPDPAPVAVEAALVVNDFRAALLRLDGVLSTPSTTLYTLHWLYRRLIRVWQLDIETAPGAQLLPPLRAAILARGGQLDLATEDLKKRTGDRRLEGMLNAETATTLRWYQTGLSRARTVARIDASTGPVGTGFAVPGDALHRSFGKQAVLLTTASVLTPDRSRFGVTPEEARVTFESETPPVSYGIGKILFHSPVDALDVTIATLDRPAAVVPPYPIATDLPEADGEQRIYLIGHPRGGPLVLSLTDNTLLDAEDPVLHYRTPTEAGSSGSPIFNRDWELIGIHHAGGPTMRRLHGRPGTYAANEGIAIGTIIRELRRTIK